MVMALSYKVLTLNCKGLNNRIKVKRLSNWLSKEKPNVLFLQETHQKKNNVHLLKSKWFELQYLAGGSSKARGVAIDFLKGMQLRSSTVLRNHRGRYVFVKCYIDETPYTFALIYVPNNNQIKILREVFELLSTFQMGELLIGGDFNLVPYAVLDRKEGPR